ncbi:MAG: S8 family serine peptidase [Bdellovibrionaceae bacterium]|nr:S8 family serine peptidase [Bdellovibrio sp.]
MKESHWGHLHVSRDLFLFKQNKAISITELNRFWNAHEPHAGNNVDVYLVDTGILQSHTEFTGAIEVIFDPYNNNGTDQIGHGTAIASLISGITLGSAPAAKLLVLKIFEHEKSSTQEQMIEALQVVLRHHINKNNKSRPAKSVLHLSLTTSPSDQLYSIIEQLALAGVLIILASDNLSRLDHSFKFESIDSIIQVAGFDQNLQPLSVAPSDVFAPGKDICVALPTDTNAYSTLSGNSIAAGFVTGVAAALWSKVLSFEAKDIRHHLVKNSDPQKTPHFLMRTNQIFEPKWSASESGIIEAIKPNSAVFRKLRCANPAKGPLKFKLMKGFLPLGLTLSEDGVISGLATLSEIAKPDHLNYFSTIIRAENEVGSVDRNISLVVTENFTKIRQNKKIISTVQLAKCDGADLTFAINMADNAGAPVDGNTAFGDGYVYPTSGDCCFNSSSLVQMYDGSIKPISEICIYDLVLQDSKPAKVLAAIALPLGDHRKIYQLNNLPIFITDEHPIYGADGSVLAIDPICNKLASHVQPLKVGSLLKTISKDLQVTHIKEITSTRNELVYHLFVEGDGSYYVGDILTCPKHEGRISIATIESPTGHLNE